MSTNQPKEVTLWVNPPNTALPLEESPVRVAVGTPRGPSTNSWKVWVRGDDVYVTCRDNFRELKASLHASGTWRFGFTDEAVTVRPELVPEGKDRVWKKWKPDLSDPGRATVGFQLLALQESLFLQPSEREAWPDSVVFVEPLNDAALVTVVSVTIVQSQLPLRMSEGTHGAVMAILPLGEHRTMQLVATYEPIGDVKRHVEGAFAKMIAQVGGVDQLPERGSFFVLGNRGEDTPWVTAVRFAGVS